MRFSRSSALSFAVGVGLVSACFGQAVRSWVGGPVPAYFESPVGWSGNLVPGTLDTAQFHLASTYEVLWWDDAGNTKTNASLDVLAGNVTFRGEASNPSTYALTNATINASRFQLTKLPIILNSTLTLTNGGRVDVLTGGRILGGAAAIISLGAGGSGAENLMAIGAGGSVAASRLYVGDDVGKVGRLTVSGTLARVTLSDDLYVCRNGAGSLAIGGGATVMNQNGWLGATASSIGTALVGGASSTWVSTGNLTLGNALQNGVGRLTINSARVLVGDRTSNIPFDAYSYISDSSANASDGGTLCLYNGSTLSNNATYGFRIGFGANESGRILVSGTGTALTNGYTLAGKNGNGVVNIESGAKFTAAGLALGTGTGGVGTVTVDGANSVLSIHDNLNIGDLGNGTVTSSGGGSILIGDAATAALPGDLIISDLDLVTSHLGGDVTVMNGSTFLHHARTVLASASNHAGTAYVSGAGSTWDNTGDVLVGNSGAAVIDIDEGGTFRARSQLLLGVNATANGTVTLTGDGSQLDVTNSLVVGGAGTGTVELAGGELRSSSVVRGANSTFNFIGGKLVTSTFTGQLTQQGGTLAPGGTGSHGETSVVGNYTQSAGVLEIDLIAGLIVDALSVNGTATLGGTLDLRQVSYVPTAGDVVQLIEATTLVGRFSSVAGVQILPSLSLAVTYDSNSVTVQTALPGDATLNRMVDFDDLLILAQNYDPDLAAKSWATGDFTGNGAANFDDLLILAQHYGAAGLGVLTSGLGERVSSTFAADWTLALSMLPEPGSATLLFLCGAAIRRRR